MKSKRGARDDEVENDRHIDIALTMIGKGGKTPNVSPGKMVELKV
jgi:hypothetical protein